MVSVQVTVYHIWRENIQQFRLGNTRTAIRRICRAARLSEIKYWFPARPFAESAVTGRFMLMFPGRGAFVYAVFCTIRIRHICTKTAIAPFCTYVTVALIMPLTREISSLFVLKVNFRTNNELISRGILINAIIYRMFINGSFFSHIYGL